MAEVTFLPIRLIRGIVFLPVHKSILLGGVLVKSHNASRYPSLDLGGTLLEICGSQQPGVALATTKERGVTLATDEMRGYPDKNATEAHLAKPHCHFLTDSCRHDGVL